MRSRSVFVLLSALLFTAVSSPAQTTRKVLFLGNSYTAFNNLPQLVHDVAVSAGDNLIFDSHTPGGYTLEAHSTDPTAQAKIMAGGWDYMVMQGQSQEPITYTTHFFDGAYVLASQFIQYNPCAVSMMYMTWGRKNGDASNCAAFPVMCTYAGMDSTLRNRYTYIANQLNNEISPVSVVWKYLRENHPGIELYNADESHPSPAGSYAAACCFYAAIFKKDPTLITYNFSLSPADAASIRNAAKTQVFDQLNVWDYKLPPHSEINYAIGSGTNEVHFNAIGYSVYQTYSWDFGDGFNSTLSNPTHAYASNGIYNVVLTTSNCDLDGTYTSVSDTTIEFCSHTPVITADSLLCEYDTLWTQPADSYQWYCSGSPIPATGQFLPNYHQYGGMGFMVKTTVGGCSELSQEFSANPEWSGYYFDAAMGGDPCNGGTRLFIVLHTSASLTGNEIIHWYKDGILLPLFNNQDTLFITTEGTYTSKVIDPLSNCPFDTTVASIEVDCDVIGIEENDPPLSWKLYPNPASEFITVELTNMAQPSEMYIYSITGQLMQTIEASSSALIDLTGLASGQYYIRIRNYPQAVIRFMKQ